MCADLLLHILYYDLAQVSWSVSDHESYQFSYSGSGKVTWSVPGQGSDQFLDYGFGTISDQKSYKFPYYVFGNVPDSTLISYRYRFL